MKKLLLLYLLLVFSMMLLLSSTTGVSTLQTALTVKIKNQLPLAYSNANDGITQMKSRLREALTKRDTLTMVAAHESLCKLYLYQCKKENAQEEVQYIKQISQANKLYEANFLLIQSQYYYFYHDETSAFANHQMLSKIITDNSGVSLQFDYAMYLGNKYSANSDSSMYFYLQALQLANAQNNIYEKVQAQIAIANWLRNKKADYKTAHLYIDSATTICIKNNFTNELCQIKNIKGGIYKKQNKYDLSIQSLSEALQLCQSTNNIVEQINCFNNLGTTEEKLGHDATAKEYFQRGTMLSIESNYPAILPRLYQNIAVIYEKSFPDSAIIYFQKAIAVAREINDKHTQAYALYNMGETLAEKKDYNTAKKNMYEALHLFEELNETSNIGWLLPCIVKLELEIKQPDKTNSNQLKSMLDKALALNANGNNFETLHDIYNAYITIYEAEKNIAMVNSYQNKLLQLKDSIYNSQKLRDGIEAAEKLNVAEQKSTIASLTIKNNETAYQRNIAFLTFGFLSIAGIALYFINKKRIARKNQIHLLAQKDAFRNQLSHDLHDEVGTLLTGLALQADVISVQSSPEQRKSLQEISGISRQAMEQMRDIVWALDSAKDTYDNLFDKMIAHAENQLGLKDIVPKFIIENFESKQSILPAHRQHIYLIFKEAIANILKHSNATEVIITMKQNAKDKILIIKDNGNKVLNHKTNGAGINSMHHRALKINGQLSIDNTSGYCITLNFE